MVVYRKILGAVNYREEIINRKMVKTINYMNKLAFFVIIFFSLHSYASDSQPSRSEFFSNYGYDPEELIQNSSNPFKNCIDAENSFHPSKEIEVRSSFWNVFFKLKEGCEFDLLYSWGSLKKARNIVNDLKLNQDWNRNFLRPIYTSPFPSSTFMYGDIPLRFKLKKETKFRGLCSTCKCPKYDKRFSNTAWYVSKTISPSVVAFEVLLCSPDVIESVSYGTKEHFEETLKDIAWVTSSYKKPHDIFSYLKYSDGTPAININFEGKTFYTEINQPHLQASKVPGYSLDGHPVDFEHFFKSVHSFFNSVQQNISDSASIINSDSQTENFWIMSKPSWFSLNH
jgi:hypothetical protein